MNVEPLVVTTREVAGADGGQGAPLEQASIENVHYGSIAVVSVDGGLMHRVGDPHWSTFTRSTLKPFQALPFVREGGHTHFGWTSRQVALMCASHSGEAMHTEVVSSMLASVDCDVTRLQCGCHVPGWYAALGKTPPIDATWSPIEHNCSGKHAGFLAACRLQGESIDDYLDPSSPLQRRAAAAVADLADVAQREMPSGTDGCSAPNYALPLSRLALLYAQLAQGTSAPKEGASLGVLFDAMTKHPELVSGTARSDHALMSLAPGDWVTKIGADGVQAIGIRSAGIGIAIKVTDGNRDALYCAVVEVLAQLGLLDASDEAGPRNRALDEPWLRRRLHNAKGLRTGRILPTFRLRPG
jgi:L-asparaginase II